jgi:Flp pilus assembly protein TadG
MRNKSGFGNDTRGTAAVIIALCLFVFMGVASLAIDMGQLYAVRNELQNVADAAALGGVAQLIQNQDGQAVRNSTLAYQSALQVAQAQSQLQGLPAVDDAARNDLTLTFGVWDIYAPSPQQAWTEIGPTCPSDSNANAMRVTIKRASGFAYGPVANFFAAVLGTPRTEVSATATAFLGFTAAAGTGTVTIPLAIPQTVMAGLKTAPAGWLARLLTPREAQATMHSFTFRDLGSDSWYQNNLYKPLFDATKAYLFVVNSSDSVPGTVIDNLKKYYTSSGQSVRAMAKGTRLYPLSEYQWAGNITAIFQAFANAYNQKKDAQGKWFVNVPVYSTTSPVAQRPQTFYWQMARRLLPGLGEAQACYTFWNQSYPGGNVPIYVNGFANVEITNVTYNPSCVTTGMPDQVTNPDSCRNTNSVNVEVPTDQSTVSPPGSVGGGPDNSHITPGGSPSVGAVAMIPKLVQ